jgi:dihydrofolate reductase/thymidylate synthase
MLNLIYASTRENGIGKDGQLPWPKLQTDFNNFRLKTIGNGSNTVVMGYKTMQSLPHGYLKSRKNIILSKEHKAEIKETEDIKVIDNITEVFKYSTSSIFIIGGAQIYKLALATGLVGKIYHTAILSKFECDTFVDPIDPQFYQLTDYSDVITENGVSYQFCEYDRKAFLGKPVSYSHGELQYLNLIDTVLQYGNIKPDRTGTGVKSLFGAQCRFDLRKEFPLLTTKKVFWRGVAEELFWIISGSTDTTILTKKGIHIWDADTCRETLDKRGFKDRRIGDLGPGYGFQLRHYGAKYIDCNTDYKGQGIDQLMNVIDKIKNNPNDRRILFCLWNPTDLDNTTLVPCHMFAQFYVTPGFNGKRGMLSCHMYIRSQDLSLGAPFNIASYSLLTCLIAQICDLYPGEFIHSMGDTHIYINTISGIQSQLTRVPKQFPKLQLNPQVRDIEKFQFLDLKLIGYQSHDAIKMPLSV